MGEVAGETGSSPLRQMLAAAREEIARGWCQGVSYRDGQGRAVAQPRSSRVCLGGALATAAAAVKPALYGPLKQLVAMKILEAGTFGWPTRADFPGDPDPAPPSPGPIIITWNDQPGRTQAEVLDLLDALLAEL